MKIKVSIELDTTDTHLSSDLAGLPRAITNISDFFQKLTQYHNLMLGKLLVQKQLNKDYDKDGILKKYFEDDIKIAEQIFNNFEISGTTLDNHEFLFNHIEPGHKDIMMVDGELSDLKSLSKSNG